MALIRRIKNQKLIKGIYKRYPVLRFQSRSTCQTFE